ncbi:MAG: ribosomal protein S6 modification protein [Hyphococcus sp.]|nr:MAG: ribosomal protein S6 modification protein [Marinicaulis sp.]
METVAPVKKKKATSKRARTLIGWREWASFPDLGIDRINAKIDTGAKSSAVHAFRIKERDIGGEAFVEFFLHPVQRRKTPEIFCRAPIAGTKIIRSSNGQEEERFVIETRLRLGGRFWKVDLTLTDRDAMGFRLLIGRDALRRKFIIDPGASYLTGA